MKSIFLISHFFIWVFMPFILFAQKDYVKARAKKGDGIYVFLGRYGLDRSDCNLKRFCELNNLTLNSYLIENRTYVLPIEKFRYDGKSVNSTLKTSDILLSKQVERYNKMMCQFKLKDEDYTKGNKELWCPHHLVFCAPILESFIPKNREFKIFGKKKAYVPLKDKTLAGAVYYIVAGHGGPDPGAMATQGSRQFCEDEYAYDISLRLGRVLLEHGAIVHFITEDMDGIRETELLLCDTDEKVNGKRIPREQLDRLNQRSELINNYYRSYKNKGIDYQRTIEIHIDSRKKDERVDMFFYYFPYSTSGKRLASLLYKAVKSKYAIYRKSGKYDGAIIPRDLHVLREAIPTTVFIEVANIQNSADRQRIVLPTNRQLLAEWLAEGLMEDY